MATDARVTDADREAAREFYDNDLGRGRGDDLLARLAEFRAQARAEAAVQWSTLLCSAHRIPEPGCPTCNHNRDWQRCLTGTDEEKAAGDVRLREELLAALRGRGEE